MLDTGYNARTTAILGLPVGWLWVILVVVLFHGGVFCLFSPKDHSNKLKVGETSPLLFLTFSSTVLLQIFFSPFLLNYNHNH